MQKATFIAGISGKTVPSGVGVIINSSGQLGTIQSSARFKEAIKPMGKVSEAIMALKPVSFRYKEELDPDKIPQFGLIAEDVEKVDPALVVRDGEGRIMSVRYDAVNAMLLNEFLKEHRKVIELTSKLEQQYATVADLASKVGKSQVNFAQQQKQIETLTSRLQQVSDQFQTSQPALVAGN